jgi:hypothetical protein
MASILPNEFKSKRSNGKFFLDDQRINVTKNVFSKCLSDLLRRIPRVMIEASRSSSAYQEICHAAQ